MKSGEIGALNGLIAYKLAQFWRDKSDVCDRTNFALGDLRWPKTLSLETVKGSTLETGEGWLPPPSTPCWRVRVTNQKPLNPITHKPVGPKPINPVSPEAITHKPFKDRLTQ